MGGVGTFGIVACVQEVAVTPGELLADADLIHYTRGASEEDEEEAIRKAVDSSTTARRQMVDWSGAYARNIGPMNQIQQAKYCILRYFEYILPNFGYNFILNTEICVSQA